MPYQELGPPLDSRSGGDQYSGYHPAPPPPHGFPPGSGYGPHNAGPQGYPGAPQPGFMFAGGQPPFGANMQPAQDSTPSQPYVGIDVFIYSVCLLACVHVCVMR